MQYLLLVYMDEQRWMALPQDEKDRCGAECDAYGRELTASGHLLDGAPLHRSATATSIRRANGKPVHTDGPFAETKEVLGGYHLVECRDQAEASAIGERFPGLRLGMTIEVRQVMRD